MYPAEDLAQRTEVPGCLHHTTTEQERLLLGIAWTQDRQTWVPVIRDVVVAIATSQSSMCDCRSNKTTKLEALRLPEILQNAVGKSSHFHPKR